MPSPLQAAALRYAAHGWPVFLLSRSKRPVANCYRCKTAGPEHDPQACGCLTCHGFYAATVDPQRIAAMLAAVPSAVLAIRTGLASGLVVIDVDPRNGGDESLKAVIRQGLCPPTAWVHTGGGGFHLYYRHPGGTPLGCSPGRLGPGIDVKADGGYVVAAPSVHPGTKRQYRWAVPQPVLEMPPALAAAIQAGPAPTATAAPGRMTAIAGRQFRQPGRLLETLIDRVRHAPEGARRTTLYGCARGAARMVAAGAISRTDAVTALMHIATTTAKQSERDARNAINGGFAAEGVKL